MHLTPVRILVPRLVDATQTNPQNLNAKSLLSRFSDPSCQWMAMHYGDPLPDVANKSLVTLTRLWRGRMWPWHMMILYLNGVDAIFYPGMDWFDDQALKLRRRVLHRAPVITILEGFPGDAQREATLSKWAGHPVFCHRVEEKVVERIDRMLHQADHIIAISPFVAKMGSQLYGDKFSALPLGVDTKLIAAAAPAVKTGTAPRPCTIIGVGRVDDHKRPEMFLKLAEQFRAARFRWIGEGRRREALIMEADRRGLHNLSFPGGLPPQGVIAELTAADIFVMPSRSEGVPKVTQEAAACGLPIIAFGYYEPPTVIDGENGYRVWSDDEFALRLNQLLDDSDRRQSMGKRSSELAKTWDWDVLANKWEEEILRVIGQRRGQQKCGPSRLRGAAMDVFSCGLQVLKIFRTYLPVSLFHRRKKRSGKIRSLMSSSSRMGTTVVGQTMVVLAGNIFTLGAGLPFQIYVARVLGVNQLGSFGLVEAVVVTLSGFVGFGIAQTTVRFIPEYLAKGEHEHIRKLALLATLALAVAGAALASCIVLLSPRVMAWFGIEPAEAKLVNVMALTAPIGLLTFLYQQILRGFQKIIIMIVGTCFVALMVKIVLTVVFFEAGWGVQGYAWAVMGGGVAALAFMIGAAMRLISRLDRPATAITAPLGPWARYASISYATGQTSNIVMHLDRFILGATIGPEAVATLMVVRQLQQLPTTFHQTFLAVAAPMFAAANGTDAASGRQALYHLTTDWVMRLALPLILFLTVFGGSLLHLYGEEFRVNGTLLLLLCLVAVSITIASGPTGSLMSMSGLEAPLLRISALSSSLLLTLYALAIPLAGLLGVGVSLIAATLFVNLSALIIMRRRLAFQWWSVRYATWPVSSGLTLATVLALRAALGWDGDVPAVRLGIGLAVAYGSFLIGILLQGVSDDDRAVFDALMTRLGLASFLSPPIKRRNEARRRR